MVKIILFGILIVILFRIYTPFDETKVIRRDKCRPQNFEGISSSKHDILESFSKLHRHLYSIMSHISMNPFLLTNIEMVIKII